MYLPSTTLIFSLLAALASAAPAEQIPPNAIVTLPATCSVPKIKACHTYKDYAPSAGCPAIKCAPQTNLMCPMMIKVTTSYVPCKTNCCPSTPTRTIATSCPTCATGCVIPTATYTVTTGCKGTTTTGPIITDGPSVTLTPGKV